MAKVSKSTSNQRLKNYVLIDHEHSAHWHAYELNNSWQLKKLNWLLIFLLTMFVFMFCMCFSRDALVTTVVLAICNKLILIAVKKN